MGKYRRAREEEPENTVQFVVGEEMVPVSGLAIVNSLDENGHRIIGYSTFGKLDPATVIGQLVTLTDQLRASFVDKDVDITEVLDFGLDGEEEENE